VTFRDLSRRRVPSAGIALSFDDNTPTAWESLVPLLAEHHAHVTFFVTELETLTEAERAALHRLAGAGHDIEAHGKMHAHAVDYARDHGVAAYVEDEVLPSLDALRADGFAPAAAFAFPYGEHDAALDAAVLGHVRLVRVGVSCAR
jgi:peptidoglycan/xylan/chitin deacetylase (PgdA/CDA1 family)